MGKIIRYKYKITKHFLDADLQRNNTHTLLILCEFLKQSKHKEFHLIRRYIHCIYFLKVDINKTLYLRTEVCRVQAGADSIRGVKRAKRVSRTRGVRG